MGAFVSGRPERIAERRGEPRACSTAAVAAAAAIASSVNIAQSSDITDRFVADDAAHSLVGMVAGLNLGRNSLVAWSTSRRHAYLKARLTLIDHPIAGPIFSGPWQQPFVCTTGQFKIYSGLYGVEPLNDTTFGPPIDAQCSALTKVTYLYMPKGGAEDVAQTTTVAGVTVNVLKPLDRNDYEVKFEDREWNRLSAIFPRGVCDWSKPGVGSRAVRPWSSFAGR
jgi:hypothetical protein